MEQSRPEPGCEDAASSPVVETAPATSQLLLTFYRSPSLLSPKRQCELFTGQSSQAFPFPIGARLYFPLMPK